MSDPNDENDYVDPSTTCGSFISTGNIVFNPNPTHYTLQLPEKGVLTISNHPDYYSNRGIPGDPMALKPTSLADDVRKIEDENAMLTEEFKKVRDQVYAIRAVLGMQKPAPGTSVKLSTSLQEIALELDKRSDIFGNIDPAIAL